MAEIVKILILSTTTITFWTAYLLIQDKRSNILLNRWFSAFLLTLTAPQLYLYSTFITTAGHSLLGLIAFSTLWLKGPFIWIFTRVLLGKHLNLSQVVLHFLPCALALLLLSNYPYFFNACMLLGMTHALIYLLVSLWHLISKHHGIIAIWHGFKNSTYYWLLYVIAGLVLLIVTDLVMMSYSLLYQSTPLSVLRIVVPAFSFYLLSIALLSVYRPTLLFAKSSVFEDDSSMLNIDHSLDTSLLMEESASKDFAIAEEPKERHLELSIDMAQSLLKHLDQLMSEQHVYRQNDLSLMDLATHLNITIHQVSELLNVHRNSSFYEYINGYRLKYACDMLKDANCQLRILDIAFEAGFNNKNSFYRVFKENLGVTPNQFRGSVLGIEAV